MQPRKLQELARSISRSSLQWKSHSLYRWSCSVLYHGIAFPAIASWNCLPMSAGSKTQLVPPLPCPRALFHASWPIACMLSLLSSSWAMDLHEKGLGFLFASLLLGFSSVILWQKVMAKLKRTAPCQRIKKPPYCMNRGRIVLGFNLQDLGGHLS